MTTAQIALLLLYAAGMSAGQILFKFAAVSLGSAAPTGVPRLLELAVNPYFISAMTVYFGLSVMWTWILTFIPLSRAYMFAAAAFVITPILASLVFSEPLGPRFAIGIALVTVGLALIAQH